MKRLLALPLLVLCVGSPTALMAQNATPTAAAPATADKPPLTTEQLDQLVAPIALYPDDLLSQIFMASTYPLEIVQADRWVKANTSLKGDALDAALAKQPWDASVKSLVGFPDVLAMMSDKLDITTQLGDAFISQQKDVMAAVQRLRAKAQAAGNLQSNQQQTVTVQAAPAGSTTTQTIIIQPANPQVVYVPTYNPTVVYGAWPYPAYPPAPYYPPGYVAGTAILSFGVGVAVGAIWNNNSWGHCNWNNGSININNNINVNRNFNNTNINNTNINNINRNNANFNGGGQQWQHNPQHRQGVPYNNKAAANQFGGVSRADASQARQEFRGREAGGQSPFGGQGAGQGGNRGNAGAGTRDVNNRGGQGGGIGGGQGGRQDGVQNRGGQGLGQGQGQGRPGQSGALNDVNRGGGAARDASNRGANSRGTNAQPNPARQAGGGGGGARPQAQAPKAAPTRSAPASRPSGGGGGRAGGGGRR